jgi:hypothetical protein
VCRHIDEATVPAALRRLNFIFLPIQPRFEADADSLAQALQTDIRWFRQHTDYGEGARRWIAAGRPAGLLLRSPALEVAEHWLVSRPRESQDVVRKLWTDLKLKQLDPE